MWKIAISTITLLILLPGTVLAAKPVNLVVDQVRNGKSAVLHFSYPAFKKEKVEVSAYSSWTTTPAGKRTPKTASRSMWLETHRHEDRGMIKLDENGNGSIRLDGMPKDKMVSVRVLLKHKIPGGKKSDISKKLRFSMN